MNIALLYTGGTIGCVGSPLAPLSETKFEVAFHAIVSPIIKSQFSDCTLQFIPFGLSLDSTNLQPADWCKMARTVLDCYADYDGFVILHGTDTMAFTASALSFLLTGLENDGFPHAVLSKPVVLTGAQLPLFHEDNGSGPGLLFNTDALQNVCGAVAAAQSGIPEVCLYFNDTLFRGNRTVKTNANDFNAFSSPNYPELGRFGTEFSFENDHILHLPTTQNISLDAPEAHAFLSAQLNHIALHIDEAKIIRFVAFPAYYDSNSGKSVLNNMLKAVIDHVDIQGVILESYGEGNFPSGNPEAPEQSVIYKTLKTAHERGIVLIDCTQVLDAIVDANAYAAGSWLGDAGVAGAYDMTPIAALTKLIYLTALKNYNGYNWDKTTIRHLMQTNLTGEVMDVNRLDSRGKWYLGAGESIEAFDNTAILINDFSIGPVLKDAAGNILWQALTHPVSGKLPGRLYMQGDGNLMFFDNSNAVSWSSNTGSTNLSTSMLILEGQTGPHGLRLYIYNYARRTISTTLYPT